MGFDHRAVIPQGGLPNSTPTGPRHCPSILLDDAAQVAGQFGRQPGPVRCGAVSWSQPHSKLNKWVRITCPDGVHVASQTHGGPLEAVCLPHRQGVTENATSPSPWKEYSSTPQVTGPRNSHWSGKPLRFRRAHSPPSGMQTSHQRTPFARCGQQSVIDVTDRHVVSCKGKTKSLLMTGPRSRCSPEGGRWSCTAGLAN